MEKIQLQDYTIYIGNAWTAFNNFLETANYSKLVVVVDENTRECCLPLLYKHLSVSKSDLHLIEIPSGEQHKTLDTCTFIWNKMMDLNADRNSLCINLGGGVIGDMGGFCASTFKRGMDFIQVPTTLLSQVDASIGGKLGIDFNHIKNSIGVFRNPQAVFVLPEFLQTLSKREIRSGFGEIIKHSLICDAEQWQHLQSINDLDQVDWTTFLVPSLKIKQHIVEQDPFEKGLRKALNFGHTVGHGVEGIALNWQKPLLHGEAIAIGMIAESWLSNKIAGLPRQELEEITDFFLRIYDRVPLREAEFDSYIHLMKKDKKNEGAEINFTLLNAIGDVRINESCSVELIEESLLFYQQKL